MNGWRVGERAERGCEHVALLARVALQVVGAARKSRLASAPAHASGLPPNVEMLFAGMLSMHFAAADRPPPRVSPLPTPFANVSRSGIDAVRLVAPEVLAGATEAGLHLVGDEQDPVLVEHLLHGAEEARRAASRSRRRPGSARRSCRRRRRLVHMSIDVAEVLHARGRVRVVVEVAERAAQAVAAVHELTPAGPTGSSATTIGCR